MNKYEIQKLPKIDLHCHLDGSLNLSCISELLNRKVEMSEIQVADDCKSLTEYLTKFNLPLQALQTTNGLKCGAYNVIKDAAAENIKYIEVRFAPQLSVNNNLSIKDVVEAVIEGLKLGKEKFGVESNAILCLMRGHSPQDNIEVVKIAREYLGHGVCAIDLAGDESNYPIELYANIFRYAETLKIPFTIHAGECGRYENVRTSVNLGARRIGHGIALRGNMKAQIILANHSIGIEMCPISNQQTKSVTDISHYPIEEFLGNGMLVTLNTDNRIVSNTSLTKEIIFVQDNFKISDTSIMKMMNNAIKVSFASDDVKHSLLKHKSFTL